MNNKPAITASVWPRRCAVVWDSTPRPSEMIYKDEHGKQFVSSLIAERGEFWWNERKPDEPSLWDSKIELGEKFFNEIIRHPVPLDMNTLTALKRCSLGVGSLPVAHLPDLRAQAPAADHLEAPLRAVRCKPSERD